MAAPWTDAMVSLRPVRTTAVLLALCVGALVGASCGGGGGAGPVGGGGGGLVLLTFDQEARDDVALNTVLRWLFSAPASLPASTAIHLGYRSPRAPAVTCSRTMVRAKSAMQSIRS